MSEENVEVVRASIDAFNRGDWGAALKDAGPNCEFDWSRAVGPIHGVYGREQLARVFAEIADSWESVRLETGEFIEADEHMVVPLTLHVTGRDGIEAQARNTWTITIRDGVIERACMYREREDALEAAGLE